MGVLNLVPLALLAIGSFAVEVKEFNHPKLGAADSDNFLFRGKKWVVLVAGSSGWSNYRHQADICHAYQIIRGNGIPAENIITMMVDDIVNNTRNPTPGKIVNQPDGPNVYEGVVIDYKGIDVNTINFLNIITGNKSAMHSIGTGKVIEGGPFDRIFINYVDHGATGVLGFPNDFLYADQLNNALKTMYRTSSYKKLLLYIEACKAGSMFDGILSENTDVLAVTASGPRENSFGCYCRSQSEPYRTCLGDLFSVTWMEDLDATVFESSAKKRTVFNDFKVVRTNVTESNVMVYGDFDTGHEKLSAFIGNRQNKEDSTSAKRMSRTDKRKMTMSSRDANELEQQLEDSTLTVEEKRKLKKEQKKNKEMRNVIDKVFQNIYKQVLRARPDISKNEIGEIGNPKNIDLTLDLFPCYRSILNKITDVCFSLPRNVYTFDKFPIFANLCAVDKNIDEMVGKLVAESCKNVPKNIDNVY